MGFDRIRPINIIVGRNNSGKSTLLDACRIAFSADPHPDGVAITLSKIVSNKDVETIPDDPREFRDGSLSSRRCPKRFCQGKVQDAFMTAEQVSFDQYKFLDFQTPLDELAKVDRMVFEFAGSVLSRTFAPLFTGWRWNAISSERNVVPETIEGHWIPQPNGSGMTRCVENLMNRAEANRVDLIETRLIPAMNSILGPDNVYERITLRRNGNLWEMYLEEKTKGSIPISATGSGVKTVLQVLMNLTVLPEAINVSPSDCIFAFEELENNLHPATVRRLFSYLRSYSEKKNCHFFITTHSHIVIDMFSNDELAQILHVTHDGQFASVRTLESHSHAMDTLDDLDVRASDLLQTNVVVWVEGPTDAMYFERWIDLHTDCKLRRGVDYQCVTYGGSVGSHLTFNLDLQEKLIEATRICRHSIFIADSNRSSAKADADKHAIRIAEEVDRIGGFSWITVGREIENYLPVELVANAANTSLEKLSRYADIYKAIRAVRGNKTEMSKIVLANRVIPQLAKENMYLDDLKERLTEVCKSIGQWNQRTL